MAGEGLAWTLVDPGSSEDHYGLVIWCHNHRARCPFFWRVAPLESLSEETTTILTAGEAIFRAFQLI